MKRILFMIGVVLSCCGMTSCYSIYEARGTAGIKAISDSANVNPNSLQSQQSGLTITYNITNNEAIIANTSERTLYIDKAKSYYIDNSNQSYSLFNNSVTTYTTSSTKGATVNMGSVARAVGIGGPVGALANGVNVGSSTTNGATTQVVEQQYVVIPPFASQAVALPAANYYHCISGKQAYENEYTFETSPIKSQYVWSFAFEGDQEYQYKRDGLYLAKEKLIKGKFSSLIPFWSDGKSVSGVGGSTGALIGYSVLGTILTSAAVLCGVLIPGSGVVVPVTLLGGTGLCTLMVGVPTGINNLTKEFEFCKFKL